MFREIAKGIYWIQECGGSSINGSQDWHTPEKGIHSTRSAFLIVSDSTLLFDTLSPAGRERIIKCLETILDGRKLDYIVPSHPENPHAGNTFAIKDEFPNAKIAAPKYSGLHELYHLGSATKVAEGDVLDLGRHSVTFLKPYFMDHFMHIWMKEIVENVLFCVDWFGLPHMDDECLNFTDEIDSPITVNRLAAHPQRPFFWFKYVDTDKTNEIIDGLNDEFRESMLAPTHGLVIRKNQFTMFQMMKEVISGFAENSL